ncbi:hypothetical protein Tco_1523548 [Tanacetum coccineum]
MPYKKPPPILKEEAEITRYSIGAGEVYTKSEILEVNMLPRTMGNIANIRVELIKERNMESEDLSATKRRHWCLLEGKQESNGGIFDNIKYLILFSKMQYVARNTGNGQENEESMNSYETLWHNPTIVLRRNLFKATRVITSITA